MTELWPKLTVRRRFLLQNLVMVLVPVLLLVFIGAGTYYGLRATGNFRDREMELLWPEAGSAVPVSLALSHLRAHVDMSELEDGHQDIVPRRYFTSVEALGMRVAVLHDGQVNYETEPGNAQALVAETYARAPMSQNIYRWDDDGLVFRYQNPEHRAIAVAVMDRPFVLDEGYFPANMARLLEKLLVAVVLLASLIIAGVGYFLARRGARHILQPLTELQQSARRIGAGDYDTSVPVYHDDELGETAAVFERMRQQLRSDRQLRKRYERNRQELMAGIAHDLATPLTKIQGFTEGITDGIDNTPEKRRHYLERIHATSKQMEGLVRQLFLVSKLELGEVAFQWQQLPVRRVLQGYVAEQQDNLPKGFDLRFADDWPQDSEPLLRLDRDQFHRVLDNLLSNSIRYQMGDQGSLTFQLYRSGEQLVIRAQDTGKGVVAEELPHLFESFYRTDKARVNVAGGSGLGLAIVRHIIEAMQGSVRAEQVPEGGLRIVMTFPWQERREKK